MITFLAEHQDLNSENLSIEEGDYRHLIRARRMVVGDSLRVVDGRGNARWATVARIERRRAEVTLGEKAPTHEPGDRVDLLVAALRPERAAWLVEKATEIGVSSIRFLATARTPRQLGDARLARLRRVAKAAVEQCHRSYVPELTATHPWDTLPELLRDHEKCLFLDPQAANLWPLPGADASCAFAVLIGPEGGFSSQELQQLEELGCQARGLGPRILRIETAAIVGLAKILLRDT